MRLPTCAINSRPISAADGLFSPPPTTPVPGFQNAYRRDATLKNDDLIRLQHHRDVTMRHLR